MTWPIRLVNLAFFENFGIPFALISDPRRPRAVLRVSRTDFRSFSGDAVNRAFTRFPVFFYDML